MALLDYYRSRDGRAFLERQMLILAAAAVALVALFGDGRIDLAVARWFYDDSLHAFPLANHWLFERLLHDSTTTASAATALALLVVAATLWATQPTTALHAYRAELLLTVTGCVAAAATVGILKHFSAHACPWDLALFGGTETYRPLLGGAGAAAAVRGCFPAAHPLSGYSWLAAGLALYPFARHRARQAWAAAFALGTVFGAVQVVRGAHFPSHVLWSAWVVWTVDILLVTAAARLPMTRRARVAPLARGGAVAARRSER